jgi:hypothetical protein
MMMSFHPDRRRLFAYPQAWIGRHYDAVASKRLQIDAAGISSGAVTLANGKIIASRRPELVPLVEHAARQEIGLRNEPGLGRLSIARILIALGEVYGPDSILAKIAVDLNFIARNTRDGEQVAAGVVDLLRDTPVVASVATSHLRLISNDTYGTPYFNPLIAEVMRLTEPETPLDVLKLLQKMHDALPYQNSLVFLTYALLSRAGSAAEALAGLAVLFPHGRN